MISGLHLSPEIVTEEEMHENTYTGGHEDAALPLCGQVYLVVISFQQYVQLRLNVFHQASSRKAIFAVVKREDHSKLSTIAFVQIEPKADRGFEILRLCLVVFKMYCM